MKGDIDAVKYSAEEKKEWVSDKVGKIILIVFIVIFFFFWAFFGFVIWENYFGDHEDFHHMNVDVVRQGCILACVSENQDAYCRLPRKIYYGNGAWEGGSCETLGKESGRGSIADCPEITCDSSIVPSLTNVDAEGGLEQ